MRGAAEGILSLQRLRRVEGVRIHERENLQKKHKFRFMQKN